MQKRELSVHRRYEPSRLGDKYLADAYEQLLKYSAKMNNETRGEKNDSSKFICESFIKKTSAGKYNRESDCRVGTTH